jgi:hypothetical protein
VCLSLGRSGSALASAVGAALGVEGLGRSGTHRATAAGDHLPDYRIVRAPLYLDGIAGNFQVTRQQLAPSSLPDFAPEHISERIELREGVGGP